MLHHRIDGWQKEPSMTTVHAVVQNGRTDIVAPDQLPDGTPLRLEVTAPMSRIGIPESEWRDDHDAITEWCAWLKTIETVEFRDSDSLNAQFRMANVDAVRRMMAETEE
jgi:hypothetical protein